MSCNSVSMRVEAPPSRCRSDSVSPRSATGPQRSEAGINGGAWQPQVGYPVSQASMDSASKGVWSHRDHHPAQEADTLEPKGHRIGRRQSKPLTGLHCHRNPVESTVLRMRSMEIGNGITQYVLSWVNLRRCQPHGVLRGIPQEAKAESNGSYRLTCRRSCVRDRRE